MTSRGQLLLLISTGTFVSSSVVCRATYAVERPNIVLMIADDCTYRDLQCYGSANSITPNINRLATEGMRFENFFQATAMSSPTRHCLMTGMYPVRTGAYPNHTFAEDGTKSIVHYLKEQGYRVALQGKRHISPVSVFDYEYLSKGDDDVNIDLIKPFINDAKSKDEPFCLFVCSHQPHVPWNKGDVNQFDPAKFVLPPFFVDTPETRADFRRYMAEVTYMDSQVGNVMAMLREAGIEDNTVFMFTSEQGNQMPFSKWTCYDTGLRTAMIVRWPGVVAKGSTCGALAEYVDVVPTMVEIAGGKPAANLEGRSIVPLLEGKSKEHKTEVYSIQTTRGVINGSDYYGIRSVRNKKFSYIRNLTPEAEFQCGLTSDKSALWQSWRQKASTDKSAALLVNRYQNRPAEELYDCVNDPYQLKNLAEDPKYKAVKKELSDKLDAWMKSQGDQGQKTELEAFKHQSKSKEE